MFFCEAMQVVHDERKAGNEAFKALCNLPPFDGIVAEVQELCESSEKHKTIIEGMQALKESAQFKELEEHMQGGDHFKTYAKLLEVCEAHEIQFKNVPAKLQHGSDLSIAAGTSLQVFVGACEPVTARLLNGADTLITEFGSAVIESGPDIERIETLVPAGQALMLIHAPLKICCGMVVDAVARCHLQTPEKVATDALLHLISITSSTDDLIIGTKDLMDFLEGGILNPSGARLNRASTLIGNFYSMLHKVDSASSESASLERRFSECMEREKVLRATTLKLRTWSRPFANELVTPLQDKFFTQVFIGKCCGQDTRNTNV